MRMANIAWIVAGLLVVFLIILASGFRTETSENTALGTFYYKYSLWQPSVVSLDSNNDGKVDAIGFLKDGADDFRDSFKEYLEDQDFDGYFEVRAIFLDGVLYSVEVDRDHDGIMEKTYLGQEAENFFLQRIDRKQQ